MYAAFFKESAKSPVISDALTDKDSSHVTYRTSLKEAPVFMVVPLALTGIGTLVLFFVPSVFLDLAKMTALTAIGGS